MNPLYARFHADAQAELPKAEAALIAAARYVRDVREVVVDLSHKTGAAAPESAIPSDIIERLLALRVEVSEKTATPASGEGRPNHGGDGGGNPPPAPRSVPLPDLSNFPQPVAELAREYAGQVDAPDVALFMAAHDLRRKATQQNLLNALLDQKQATSFESARHRLRKWVNNKALVREPQKNPHDNYYRLKNITAEPETEREGADIFAGAADR